jgi:hypothetical protein
MEQQIQDACAAAGHDVSKKSVESVLFMLQKRMQKAGAHVSVWY